jgi:glycosyltransferase involved in cell wall biosynthesis
MLTRTLAMAAAGLAPGRAARDVPGGIDVMHYPVTVPIPRTDAPTVVTLHDVLHHDLPGFVSRAETLYRRRAYDGSVRSADVVVASSEFSRGRIADLVGVPPERIEVVPLGIDTDRFAPEADGDAAALEPLGLPESFLIYPANLWPHKNHERLLEALARANAGGAELVLTGQGYGRLDDLLARASSLGVAERVHHLGHVPSDMLPRLYRRARGMVFPSLYEGFGTPPLEAMACGLPVAASNRASLPEITGDAALLFDPESPEEIASAMEKLTSDGELRARLRAKGRERAAGYTWSAAARRHLEIYENAATSAHDPP